MCAIIKVKVFQMGASVLLRRAGDVVRARTLGGSSRRTSYYKLVVFMLLLQVLNMILIKGSRRREIDLLGTEKGAFVHCRGRRPPQNLVTFDQGHLPKPTQRMHAIVTMKLYRGLWEETA